jgi:hypothetical protein
MNLAIGYVKAMNLVRALQLVDAPERLNSVKIFYLIKSLYV